MATVFAHSNAAGVAAHLRVMGTRLDVAAREAPAKLAPAVKDIVLPLLVDEAPKVTGDLANSQEGTIRLIGTAAEVTFDAGVPYAGFVLHGTGIYAEPTAHQAWDVDKPQVFSVNGTTIFALHTHHEGQHPDDWPGRAWERGQAPITEALRLLDDRLMAVFL